MRTATAPAPPKTVAVIPTAERLVRSYLGQVEDKNGKRWMLLEITLARITNTGVEFRYTLNYPKDREDEGGTMDHEGHIRLKYLAGVARMKGTDVVLESEAIDGPPYWHAVGHAPAAVR